MNSSKVVIGYVSIWTPIDIRTIPCDKLTHIVYSFLNINITDGSIIFGDDTSCNSTCATTFLSDMVSLKQLCPSLKIHISVGGAGWSSSFLPVVKSTHKLNKLVADISKILLEYDLDGVDIDWEYPSTGEGIYFVQLAQKFRNTLDIKYELTAAIPCYSESLINYNISDAFSYFNWFNLMAYDSNVGTGYTSHQSPLYFNSNDVIADGSADRGVKTLLSANVPSSKIVLGVPLYGYQSTTLKNDEAKNGLFEPCLLNCEQIIGNLNIYTSIDNILYFDDVAKSPWLYNSNSGLFTTFEDPRSVQYKIDYVIENSLKGMMFWELGLDVMSSSSVVFLAFEGFNISSVQEEWLNESTTLSEYSTLGFAQTKAFSTVTYSIEIESEKLHNSFDETLIDFTTTVDLGTVLDIPKVNFEVSIMAFSIIFGSLFLITLIVCFMAKYDRSSIVSKPVIQKSKVKFLSTEVIERTPAPEQSDIQIDISRFAVNDWIFDNRV